VDSICLDQNYSTTRLLTKEGALIVENSYDNFPKELFLCENEGRIGGGGLRTKGYFKHSYKKQGKNWLISDANRRFGVPIELILDKDGDELVLITIITVVFNGEKFLEETIQSVINQDYQNVEYIIIDGGSTDGTLEIIRKYEHAIDYWVSEKDRGIFDAMNKGARLSKGSYLYMLNADDYLLPGALSCLSNEINSQVILPDVIYGNIFSLSKTGCKTFCPTPKSITKAYHFYNLPLHHPGAIIKSSVFRGLKGFSLTFRYSSDFDLFLRAFNDGFAFVKVNYSLSCMREGGLGTQNQEVALLEFEKSLLINNGSLIALCLCRFRRYLLIKKNSKSIFGVCVTKLHNYFMWIKYGRE